MTKQSLFIILFTLLMSMKGANAFAHDIEVANADGKTIYYVWANNKTELEVACDHVDPNEDPQRYRGKIVIPESVEYKGKTYRVTSIGHSAFSCCYDLTSVTISSSVTSIGSGAFEDCERLTSITIPNSVTSIGSEAFAYCDGLTSITIPNSVTSIGERAFENCSGLASLKVESGNNYYDSRNNCNAIIETSSNTLIAGCKNTTIPNSVKSIGSDAFRYCSGLTSITIPNSVISIGEDAFFCCRGLSSVEIPNSVKSIGSDAFRYCSGLTSIKIESGNKVYDSRNNCNAIIETSSNTLIAGCKNTTIPNSVKSIGDEAFDGCSGLTSVTIPSSVTSIGERAFFDCSGLTSVTIGNSVKSIGDEAFWGCSGLTSVTIGNSVTSIGNSAFWACSGLTSVISEIVNPFEIDNSIFYIISSNALLVVPKGTQAAYQSTAGWDQFTYIVEAGDIGQIFEAGGIYYEIGENNTVSVTCGKTEYSGNIVIPNQVTYTYLGTKYSVTSIGEKVFSYCRSLTSITIPNSVTSIGYCAFQGCI